MRQLFVNEELSLSLTCLDCLQIDSEGFILINQIFLKISFIPILLTFMYLVALYQKTELLTISSQTRTQLIIVTDNCSTKAKFGK